MEIEWKRVRATQYKRETVLTDPDIYGKSEEEKEAFWQKEVQRYEKAKLHFEKYPRFTYREEHLKVCVERRALEDREEWYYYVWWSLPSWRMLNANGIVHGTANTEASAKSEATKLYQKAIEVQKAVQNLRNGFAAKWGGGPEA